MLRTPRLGRIGQPPTPRNPRAGLLFGGVDSIEFRSGADVCTRLSPTGLEHVVYTPNSVFVVMCYAETKGDGDLTIDDFICFQTLFMLGC